MPSAKSYKGEYLWINHDENNRKDPTRTRSGISSFMRTSYRDWKRQQDAETRDRSAQLPSGPSSNGESSGSGILFKPPLRRKKDHIRTEQGRHNVGNVGPLTIVQRGNSDPFDAFAIPIDAKVNEMMNFLRNIMVLSFVNGGSAGRAHWYSYDWETSVSFLHDELTALAQFAQIAVAMHPKSSMTTPPNNSHALSFKSQSMALLRTRAAENQITGCSTYHAIYLLLLAEVYSWNFPAALMHASLLVNLLQSGQIRENFHFVFWTFSQDYQRAAMSQSRLRFDIQAWVPDFFQPFWDQTMDSLPSQTDYAKVLAGLDVTIDDEDFKSICVDIRRAHLAMSVERTMEYTDHEKSRFCRAFWTWILARLHHSYLHAAEALKVVQPFACDQQSTHTRVKAFFSLAAHCHTRVFVNVDAIKRGQITIYDANADLFLKLRDIFDDYERTAEPEDIFKYSRIQLWALYVGAHAEQAADFNSRGSRPENGWFNTRLAKHAMSMRLVIWQDVRAVLQSIHHSDGLRPHGSQWFWKTMNANAAED